LKKSEVQLKTTVICFLASYALAFVCELCQLKWRYALGRIASIGLGIAGLVAHTFYLLHRSSQSDLPPLLSSAHDWLLVLAWLAVLVYLFVSLTGGEQGTGLVMWPVVLILVVASQYVTTSPSRVLDYHRNWKMLHASLLVLGTTFVLLGFVLSMLYLWQHRRLKQRQMPMSPVKLPNLELIERLNRWSILMAVPLQTLGIASGFGLSIMAKGGEVPMTWSDPVVIGGAVTCGLMGVLFVWLLTQKRSPGRQMALLTAWACGFLLVTLVGLQMLTAAIGMRSIHGTAAVGPESEPAKQGRAP
jgi:ABC-type uncharacterized transport system permease subunit